MELGLHWMQGAATKVVIIEKGAPFEENEDQRFRLNTC